MATKLRIKLDYESNLQWMFCDLTALQSIKDLKKKIKERLGLKKVELKLDDVLLPSAESIQILNQGDVVQVSSSKKRRTNSPAVKREAKSEETSSTSEGYNKKKPLKKVKRNQSSSGTSDENESSSAKAARVSSTTNGRYRAVLEKYKHQVSSESDSDDGKNSKQAKGQKDKEASSSEESEDEKPVAKSEPANESKNEETSDSSKKKKKRKRRGKNVNKNKLPEPVEPLVVDQKPLPKVVTMNVVSQANHIKFNDEEEPEKEEEVTEPKTGFQASNSSHSPFVLLSPARKLAASSPPVTCEQMLLETNDDKIIKKAPLPKKNVNLDALLKLADNPITVKKAKKMASNDVCTNKSVVLTNSQDKEQKFDNLQNYELITDSFNPESGQTFAFKCLQIGPDYTPQMIQYVGELKELNMETKEAKFHILYDENEGKSRSDKFEIDEAVDGFVLKNQHVDFNWNTLNDIRLIP